MWWEMLANSEAVRGTFGNSPPALSGLVLVQLNMIAPSELYLNVEPLLFPDNVPNRWHEKCFDRLQLRFLFVVLTRFDASGVPYEKKCGLSIQRQGAMLQSDDGLFKLSCDYVSVRMEYYPYRMQEHDAQPLWTFIS